MFNAEMNNNDKSDVDRECASADKPNANDKTSDVRTADTNCKVTYVELLSADGKSFNVQQKVAKKFKFDDDAIAGAIREIESDILAIVIKWAEKHVNDEVTDYDSEDDNDSMGKRTDDIDEWDDKLLSLDISMLFRLLKAATCMEMKGLSRVTAKKSATMFKGKTVKELRKTLEKLRTPRKK